VGRRRAQEFGERVEPIPQGLKGCLLRRISGLSPSSNVAAEAGTYKAGHRLKSVLLGLVGGGLLDDYGAGLAGVGVVDLAGVELEVVLQDEIHRGAARELGVGTTGEQNRG